MKQYKSDQEATDNAYIAYEPTANDFISEAGIVVIGRPRRITRRNKIRNSTVIDMNGVGAANYSEDTLVEKNIIVGSRGSGIGLDGERATVIDNLILNASRGVGDLDPNDGKDYSNVDVGIEIDSGIGHVIMGNVIVDSAIYQDPLTTNPLLTKWGIADYDASIHPEAPKKGGEFMEIAGNYVYYMKRGTIHLAHTNNNVGLNYTDPLNKRRLDEAFAKIREAGYGHLLTK